MTPQELASKRDNTYTAAFHKYDLLKRQRPKDLFCFFEGKNDSSYYNPRIQGYYKGDFQHLICGNKKNVLCIYEKIKSDVKIYKLSFFVDMDFDSQIENPHIYQLPYYSVENLYVSQTVVCHIVKCVFNLTDLDQEFNDIMTSYEENKKKYLDTILLFNAWYACLKEECLSKSIFTNVSLDDSFPKDFISFKIGNIESLYDHNKIYEKYPKAPNVSKERIAKKMHDLTKKGLEKVLRGKYLIDFLYRFFKHIIDDKDRRTYLKNKTFNIDKAQILFQLSSHAETPECLKNYLRKFKAS